ncbi:MAG: hypothetical protein ABIP78_12520, partial [Pyrinomonadaceae bacterium]
MNIDGASTRLRPPLPDADASRKTAHIVLDDGSEKEISLADVQAGTKLRVRANDKIPVDGVVFE